MSYNNLISYIFDTKTFVEGVVENFISRKSQSKNTLIAFIFASMFLTFACNNEGGGMGETFRNLPEISSSNGVLHATFRLDFSKIKVAGQKVTTRI